MCSRSEERNFLYTEGSGHCPCGGLNENDSHRLIESNTIRGCGLLGASVSLGVGLKISEVQARPSVSLTLPAAFESERRTLGSFSSTSVCTPHAPQHDDNGLAL